MNEDAVHVYKEKQKWLLLIMVNKLRQCRYGKMLFNSNDTVVGRSLDLEGEWYQSEMDLLGRLINPGDIVIDVGANIGCHTVFFAQIVGEKGVVFAFEPQIYTYHLLCANIALNDLFNVIPEWKAVGAEKGIIECDMLDPHKEQNFGEHRITSSQGMDLELVPLDVIGLEKCKLIKIDVEGMEIQVIKGARNLIKKCRPIIYAEKLLLEKDQRVFSDILTNLDYDIFEHQARGWNPNNFRGTSENLLHGDYIQNNLICVPSGTATDLGIAVS